MADSQQNPAPHIQASFAEPEANAKKCKACGHTYKDDETKWHLVEKRKDDDPEGTKKNVMVCGECFEDLKVKPSTIRLDRVGNAPPAPAVQQGPPQPQQIMQDPRMMLLPGSRSQAAQYPSVPPGLGYDPSMPPPAMPFQGPYHPSAPQSAPVSSGGYPILYNAEIANNVSAGKRGQGPPVSLYGHMQNGHQRLAGSSAYLPAVHAPGPTYGTFPNNVPPGLPPTPPGYPAYTAPPSTPAAFQYKPDNPRPAFGALVQAQNRRSTSQTTPQELIYLKISMRHIEKHSLQPVGEVCAGLSSIDAHIGVQALHVACFNALLEPWKEWSCGTPLAMTDTRLHLAKRLAPLDPPAPPLPDVDAVYQYCLKGSKVRRFDAGHEVELHLVVTDKKYREALDADEPPVWTPSQPALPCEPPHVPGPFVAQQVPGFTHESISAHNAQHATQSASGPPMHYHSHGLPPQVQPMMQSPQPQAAESPRQRQIERSTSASHSTRSAKEETPVSLFDAEPADSLEQGSVRTSAHLAQGREPPLSSDGTGLAARRSSSSTPGPEREAAGNRNRLNPPSLDRLPQERFSHALAAQTRLADARVKESLGKDCYSSCEFFALPVKPMDQLLTDYVIEPTTLTKWTGQFDVRKERIGRPGSFKTAHLCTVRFDNPSELPEAFQFFTGRALCAKQIHQRVDGSQKLFRLCNDQEMEEIWPEVQCLVWAHSGLDMANAWVAEQQQAHVDLDLTTPSMRFVRAMVAICHGEARKRVYLLEEYIDPKVEGRFVKYVHNSQQEPALVLNDDETQRAEFLCFTQHVQWMLSSGTFFLSDYQGGKGLLTDPQVITKDGKHTFAAGNLYFDAFCDQHRCNIFCEAFGLESLKQPPADFSALEPDVDLPSAMSTSITELEREVFKRHRRDDGNANDQDGGDGSKPQGRKSKRLAAGHAQTGGTQEDALAPVEDGSGSSRGGGRGRARGSRGGTRGSGTRGGAHRARGTGAKRRGGRPTDK
ncbi:hypothetical protein PsYK624_046010 [Phanerochaete sordida]|uniref:Alpha-type protein kinase domain-containing protein n=1 Tax=Phanerochaete sordida TaxID=48140 RepID=A0A9P3G3M8_9APHY|nr:hypothetical protein PsYK624_046010 [Phanerochaete sordida]